jgi:PadR family transcriptional regulator PadR
VDAQLKKGFLELLVLASLKSDASYGYRIIQDVSKVVEISESTLYPILKRLEAQNYLVTYNEEFNSRLRKYYQITSAGKQRLKDCRLEFDELKKMYDYILG